MRSILEKALIALLNEEREKADALFHEFILERSRQIHESLRQGEDFVLDESWENELAVDEMFTEADLIGEDDEESEDSDEQVNEFAFDGDDSETTDTDTDADVDADAEADVDSEEDADADSAIDADVDAETDVDAEDGDIETRVDDIEAELQKLAAEFDALVAGEDDAIDAVRDDTEGGDFGDMDADVDAGDSADADAFGDDTQDDEEFANFGESVTTDLEKVSVKMVDGTEQGGGKITQNKKSPGLQPKLDQRALKGEPVQIKATEHNGYDREASPKTKDMPKRQNVKAKAADGRSTVKKEGDSSATLNDTKADPAGQKSLIGSGKNFGKN